jgi:DNA-binding PadR family transcriptional regulator
MVVRVHELTGFQRDLLYVIAGFDRPSGQQVATELEAYQGEEITHGRLYPNLDTLVEIGLVEKGQLSRRTNYYALTDDGAATLRARRAWENDRWEF